MISYGKSGRKRKIQTDEIEIQQNPKLSGSNIVDCIPQTGQCPNNCIDCFYNSPGWFRTKSESLFPPYDTKELVRVNCGHDSNIHKQYVIESTVKYKDKFYNTSMPYFDFPGPVVFTCNGRDTDNSAMMVRKGIDNLMAVRFRTNLWNLDLLYEVIAYYSQRHKIPVIITFMRYTKLDLVPDKYQLSYVYKKSILNEYYMLLPEKQDEVEASYFNSLVGRCGKSWSSFCRDCGRCSNLYKDWMTKSLFRRATAPELI